MLAELEKIKTIWPEFGGILSVPRNKRQYKKLVSALDELLDEIGEDERHPHSDLLETVGTLIENYEKSEDDPLPEDPIEVLKFLMTENELTQKDLDFIGSQGVVSEILNGKRSLNLRQVKSLADKFNVSPAAFI